MNYKLLSTAFFAVVMLNVACKSTKVKSTRSPISMIGTEWQLIELKGQLVDSKTKPEEHFIKFQEDKRYAAKMGCNGMGGDYKLDEANHRISFSRGIQTMMACEDMSLEQGFSEIVEQVDNYSLSGDTLSLNKARMAPLAKFRLIKK